MKKKRISIDINEVIRAHWTSVETYYTKFMGDSGEIVRPFNTYEYLNHFKFKEKMIDVKYLKEKLKEVPVEWYHTPTENGEMKADAHLFDKSKEMMTAEDQLNRFLYEDYLLEVFGHCAKVYSGVAKDIDDFYRKNKEEYDIKIVSLEEYKSIPATLFFLSKIGMHISDYSFYGDPNRLWRECDICITTNPKILESRHLGKISIKVEREFNSDFAGTKTITNISDIVNEDFKKFIKRDFFTDLLF